jgi:hypothetical protein
MSVTKINVISLNYKSRNRKKLLPQNKIYFSKLSQRMNESKHSGPVTMITEMEIKVSKNIGLQFNTDMAVHHLIKFKLESHSCFSVS